MSNRRSSVFLALLAAAAAASGHAAEPEDARSPSAGSRIHDEAARLWTVRMANDAFAFVDRDRDYTAGFAFALNGEQARRHWLSPLRVLDWVDDTSRFFGRAAWLTPQSRGIRARSAVIHTAGSQCGTASVRRPAVCQSPLRGGVEADARRGARRGISVVALARVPRVAGRRAGAHRRPRAQRQQASRAATTIRSRRAVSRRSCTQRPAIAYSRAAPSESAVRIPCAPGSAAASATLRRSTRRSLFARMRPWWESAFAASDYAGHPQVSDAVVGEPCGGHSIRSRREDPWACLQRIPRGPSP